MLKELFYKYRWKFVKRYVFVFCKLVSMLNLSKKPKSSSVTFYPEKPNRSHIIWKLCKLLNLNMCAPEGSKGVLFYWESKTASSLSVQYNYINSRCVDVSKKYISKVFDSVFDYPISVDPLRYEGWCVEKSDVNAVHDGRLVKCPIVERSEGAVYQVFADNAFSESYSVDLRTVISLGRPVLVYLKFKPLGGRRFGNSNYFVKIRKPGSIFSQREVENISKFCLGVGLEYGEIDILRDRTSNRIYIVDVSKTPYGPPNGVGFFSSMYALMYLASIFKRDYLNQS